MSAVAPSARSQDDAGDDRAPSGWLEAGDSEDEAGTRVRTYSVLLDDEGNIHGKIFRVEGKERKRVPAARIKLSLVQEGEVVAEGETNPEDGVFKVGPLKPGIYSLIGQGEGGLVAFSLNAESPDPEEAKEPKKDDAAEPGEEAGEPKQVLLKEIETCALNPADVPMALQLIQAFLGVGSGGQPAAEPDLEATDDEPAEKAEEQAEMPAETPAKPSRSGQFRGPSAPDAVPSTTLSWQAVSLQKNGNFVGLMRMLEPSDNEQKELKSRPPVDMRVFIIKDGKVLAQGPCSKMGYFVIEGLKPDLYSFLSVGVDGFSATTLDVLPAPKEEAGKNSDDDAAQRGLVRPAIIRLVSFARLADDGSPPKFEAANVPEEDSKAVNFVAVTGNPNLTNTTADPGVMLANNGPAGGDGTGNGGGSGSGFSNAGGGASGVGTAPGTGGGGGGVPGGGGNNNNGGGGGEIPEIDPASAGVGFAVLFGLMLLLVDLFRPR